MLPEPLQQYLQANKDQHISFTEVKQKLLDAGWSAEIIEQASMWYVGTNNNLGHSQHIAVQGPIHKPPWLALGVFIFFILLLASSSVTSAYLIATNKIPMSSDSPLKVASFKLISALPFLPKTPTQVLQMSYSAHQKINKHKFNLVVTAKPQSTAMNELLNISSFEIKTQGYVDYSMSQYPLLSVDITSGNDFSLSFLKPSAQQQFIKVNSIPAFLSMYAGTDLQKYFQIIAGRWIILDSQGSANTLSSLESMLPANSQTSITNGVTTAVLSKFLTDEVLPTLVMSEEKLGDVPVYKISFLPTPQLLDKFVQAMSASAPEIKNVKLSDYIKNTQIHLWIDKNSNLVLRSDLSATVVYPTSVNSSTDPYTFDFTTTLNLSDFGLDQPLQTPTDYTTLEEVLRLISASQPNLTEP